MKHLVLFLIGCIVGAGALWWLLGRVEAEPAPVPEPVTPEYDPYIWSTVWARENT